MQDIAITSPQAYGTLFRPTYHHRNVPAALRNVARQMLEAGNPEDVGLRELSRRIGISATAAYRHFSGRDDLMASVAVEGFHELTTALEVAAAQLDPMVAVGLAYLEFALAKRGMFRLMFGPLLAQRSKFPALRTAAEAAFGVIERAGLSGEPDSHKDTAGMAAWGLIHGLSALFIENLVPAPDARELAQQIFAGASLAGVKAASTV
jgi:AcrR family transcriptional regulator